MKLIEPSIEFDRQIRAYRKEFLDCEDALEGATGLKRFEEPKDWIEYVNKHKDPATLPQGRVLLTQYILVREEDQKIVGMTDIRHYLNPYLERYGGHIGYSVAPSERHKGYASQMLQMSLPKCRDLGIDKILLLCNSDNEGSKRTILKNGGVYESTVYDPEEGLYVEHSCNSEITSIE